MSDEPGDSDGGGDEVQSGHRWLSKNGLFGGIVIALIGAGGAIISSGAGGGGDPVCERSFEFVADQNPNPYLSDDQRRAVVDSTVRTVLECQRRRLDG